MMVIILCIRHYAVSRGHVKRRNDCAHVIWMALAGTIIRTYDAGRAVLTK